MTRKDFTLIADILAATKPDNDNDNDRFVWAMIARTFAERLESANPNFKKDRFLTAVKYGR